MAQRTDDACGVRASSISDPDQGLRIKPLNANLSKACYDLAAELPILMRHWPKTTRMGLGRRVEENAYQLLESAIVIANPLVPDIQKVEKLSVMSSASDVLLVYLRLSRQLKNVDDRRYMMLSEQILSIGRQVGGLSKFMRKADNLINRKVT